MDVRIKSFDVEMKVKSKGIEFEVHSADATKKMMGDCYLTMTGLTWCKGRTTKENGVRIKWADFIDIMKSSSSVKAAVKAARSS